MDDKNNTKELQVLDEMGNKVREITKFEQTVEGLKEIVKASALIKVLDVRDRDKIAVVKSKRLELRKIEIDIERRGLGYRRVFSDINKEISSKEKELKKITSPEIGRLARIEEESENVMLLEKRKALLPARRERLMEIDSTGCYICEEKYLLEMDADTFEKYINDSVANKNERNRIKAEDEAEAKRKTEREQINLDRMALEAEKKKIEDQKEADRIAEEKKAEDARIAKEEEDEEIYQKEQAYRVGLLGSRKKDLEEIGDKVPMLEDRLMLAMDDNEYTTYYNNRVTAKNTADKQAIEDNKRADEEARVAKEKADTQLIEDKRLADEAEEAEKERIEKEEKDRKAEMEKKELYKKFLKINGWTPETRDQFESREVEGGYELWKKVGVFKK
ncbi:MAG TPA: hypothetical protein ENI63_02025 [Candidatus Kaiserbacteria bacterium]|nr:hypothetical protein [Candidatus Kaiserbacteria bacterium]